MTTRFDIYEAWDGGLRIDIDQDNGEWVKYEDHAEAMQKLWRTADTRERMNSQTIATLRAKVEKAESVRRTILRNRRSILEERNDD